VRAPHVLIFAESNFYTAMAVFMFDLVVFGTAVLLIYEDFDNVINCINPCFGEYYVDIDGKYRPCVFYREFTYTISQTVDEFGWENCSSMIQQFYDRRDGAGLTREVIIAHAIEPNTEPEKYGIPKHFKYREPTGNGVVLPILKVVLVVVVSAQAWVNERAAIIGRWDLVGNDPYGRSVGMDALPDIKQLSKNRRKPRHRQSINPLSSQTSS